jgi:hypothetical protein
MQAQGHETFVAPLVLDGEDDQGGRAAALAPRHLHHDVGHGAPQPWAHVGRVAYGHARRVQVEQRLDLRRQRDAEQPRRVSRHAEDAPEEGVVRVWRDAASGAAALGGLGV